MRATTTHCHSLQIRACGKLLGERFVGRPVALTKNTYGRSLLIGDTPNSLWRYTRCVQSVGDQCGQFVISQRLHNKARHADATRPLDTMLIALR